MINLAYCFFLLGTVFMVLGTIGMIIFPDVYTRLHPAGKAGTAGLLSIFIGLILYGGFSATTARIIVIALFTLVTAPVATHAIARGAFESGLAPWRKKKND